MEYIIYKRNDGENLSITTNNDKEIIVTVSDPEVKSVTSTSMNPKELSDFIGVLLHIQAKLKKQ